MDFGQKEMDDPHTPPPTKTEKLCVKQNELFDNQHFLNLWFTIHCSPSLYIQIRKNIDLPSTVSVPAQDSQIASRISLHDLNQHISYRFAGKVG